jgi:ABC-2 type transport system ATP-binding protein
MGNPSLEVRNVSKYYGPYPAVQNISCTLTQGETVGLLGRNGAGKTSLCKILSGAAPASQGQVLIAGWDIQEQPLQAKKHLGYLPEHPPLYPELTTQEQLFFMAAIKGIPRSQRRLAVEEAMEHTHLAPVKNVLIKTLSKGYQQRVGLAQALLGNPRLLILDEPTAGLDPHQIESFRILLTDLQKHTAVLFSTHILHEVSSTCSRVLMMHQGSLVAEKHLSTLNTQGLEHLFLSHTGGTHDPSHV